MGIAKPPRRTIHRVVIPESPPAERVRQRGALLPITRPARGSRLTRTPRKSY